MKIKVKLLSIILSFVLLIGLVPTTVFAAGLQISVKTPEGISIALETEPTDRIYEVKEQIEVKTGIPVEKQQLLFADKELIDDCTLQDYGIQRDSILHLMLALNQNGYVSPYTVVFDGFEQRPELSELLEGMEGLTAEDVKITGYGNNVNATGKENLAYAEIQGINGVSGTSKIYFSINPFNLSNAKLLRSNANYNNGDALDNLLAIESNNGTYIIPGDTIALREIRAYTVMVDQGWYPAPCYYIDSSLIQLTENKTYANVSPNSAGSQTRYFIVSSSPNFVQDDSSVEQGHWDYGLSSDNRNNKMNEILNSLEKTYFSCPNSMNITIGTFTAVSQIELSVDSPCYPDYDDGDTKWNVSTNTEGINIQDAVCKLIVNEDKSACNVRHQIDIYFTPDENHIIAGNATCNFLSQNLRIQTDANTQWYKASIITSQMKDTHTWTDWEIVNEPTCTEAGKQVRKCTACGFTEINTISAGHNWGEPLWNWSDDGKTAAVTFTCNNDSAHTQSPEVEITSKVKTPATCTEKGITIYTAEVTFNGQKYTSTKDVADIAKLSHTLKKTDKVESTCTTAGKEAYYTCEVCQKHFSDAEGNNEIAKLEEYGIIPATEHKAGTEWKHNETSHWNECVNNCGEKLNEAAHTFEWVVDKEATATEAGSKHEECTVCGYEKAAVEIPAAGTTEPTDPPKPTDPDKENPDTGTTSPQTGDNSNFALWITLLFASGGALTVAAIYSRKKRKTER